MLSQHRIKERGWTLSDQQHHQDLSVRCSSQEAVKAQPAQIPCMPPENRDAEGIRTAATQEGKHSSEVFRSSSCFKNRPNPSQPGSIDRGLRRPRPGGPFLSLLGTNIGCSSEFFCLFAVTLYCHPKIRGLLLPIHAPFVRRPLILDPSLPQSAVCHFELSGPLNNKQRRTRATYPPRRRRRRPADTMEEEEEESKGQGRGAAATRESGGSEQMTNKCRGRLPHHLPRRRRRLRLRPPTTTMLLALLLAPFLQCVVGYWGLVAAADSNDPPVTVLQPGVRVDGSVAAKVRPSVRPSAARSGFVPAYGSSVLLARRCLEAPPCPT